MRGDIHQMHQAIVNFALAAQSRMPAGGRIEIQTSVAPEEIVRQKFPSAEKRDYVLIAVSDNGNELDEYSARRIFEPFFNSKERDHNAGLRLSVAYSIVRSHKGFVDVGSGKGAGTTISIYLPLENPQPIEEKTPSSDASQTGNECILVVDDEELFRQIYQQGFSSLGYRVFSAGNGEEAIAAFVEHRGEIDLVVSDHMMPKMNGEELFHKLRELDPATKLILATGAIDLKEKFHLLNMGVCDVLEKPFLLDELLASVRKTLDRGSSGRSERVSARSGVVKARRPSWKSSAASQNKYCILLFIVILRCAYSVRLLRMNGHLFTLSKSPFGGRVEGSAIVHF